MSLHVVWDDQGRYRFNREGSEVGWAEGNVIGFRGFESAAEARQAAGAAFDALRDWLARQRRTEITSGPREPLRERRGGGVTWLTVGGIAIGRIVEPQASDSFGAGGYGFELDLPPPLELVRISAAQAMYAALDQRAAATVALKYGCHA